jgi:hypothetical protein
MAPQAVTALHALPTGSGLGKRAMPRAVQQLVLRGGRHGAGSRQEIRGALLVRTYG